MPTLRVLLDERLPKKLKRELSDHPVATVQEMGWSGKKNSELIKLAREQFDVFITADQNMQHQQRLAYSGIAVIVLVAPNTRIETLKLLMPHLKQALDQIVVGEVVQIQA